MTKLGNLLLAVNSRKTNDERRTFASGGIIVPYIGAVKKLLVLVLMDACASRLLDVCELRLLR